MAQSKIDFKWTYLMIGKTGIGKSSTGNKLLGLCDDEKNNYRFQQATSQISGSLDLDQNPENHPEDVKFVEGVFGSKESTTVYCKLVSNNTHKSRVLDVRGFADSKQSLAQGSFLANLQIVREIVRVQVDQNLIFNRVVYFLPNREIPEKNDGILQEELKVMYYYFGETVFKCMVIIMTVAPYKQQKDLGDLEKFMSHTEEVITEAIAFVTEDTYKQCPPIVYISRLDSGEEVRCKIQNAKVAIPTGMVLKVKDDKCIHCAAKFRYRDDHGGTKTMVGVVDPTSQKLISYKDSKCHPLFIPKHSKLVKVVGGIAQIASLGLLKAAGVPGFFNSEEHCINCKQPPGNSGCAKVAGNDHEFPYNEHSSDIQRIVNAETLQQ